MSPVAAVARRDDRRRAPAPLVDDPIDRGGRERRPVREHDDRRVDLRRERRETAAQRRAGSKLPVGAVDRSLERVRPRDDDDLIEPLHVLEHGGKEQPLLRRAEPRRCAGSEDDGADHQLFLTVTFSITTGCAGGPSPVPSASIALTVSIPSVTVPTTA